MATRPWSFRVGWSGLGRTVLLADPAHFAVQQDGVPAFCIDALQSVSFVGNHYRRIFSAGAGADMNGAARDQNRVLDGRLPACGFGQRLCLRVQAEGVERGKVGFAGRFIGMV